MYVGGYPSLGTQQALRAIAGMVSECTPIFHWSDIDPDGAWIFHTIERAFGRPSRPHLMSVEIAERSGQVSPKKAAPARCPPDSGIAALAAYLAEEGAKTLEQEELDPVLPELAQVRFRIEAAPMHAKLQPGARLRRCDLSLGECLRHGVYRITLNSRRIYDGVCRRTIVNYGYSSC
jgi:Uncharacterized protein conserved in bacteria C-term(DUF2220)